MHGFDAISGLEGCLFLVTVLISYVVNAETDHVEFYGISSDEIFDYSCLITQFI